MEKKIGKIEFQVDFPTGSIAEINDYLIRLEEEFLNEKLQDYVVMQTGEYALKSIYFMDDWGGYEDHDYYLIAEIEETEEHYKARVEAEYKRKQKEAEELKKRQEVNLLKKEKQRQEEIKKLEAKLKELKGG
jgi:hypothetical protein